MGGTLCSVFQEWIEELAKLAVGLAVTVVLFAALWMGINSVGTGDDSPDGEPELAESCFITQPGETEPAETTCSNAQVLLEGAAESFQSDDPCPIEMIMIEAPEERWCLSASAEPEALATDEFGNPIDPATEELPAEDPAG